LRTQGYEKLFTQDSKALEVIILKISQLEKTERNILLLSEPHLCLTNKTLKGGGLVFGILSIP
jgi:hypothetical protein